MVKSRDYKNILRKKNSRSIFIYTFDSKGMDLRWIRARRRRCRSPPRRGGGFCVRGSQLLFRIGDSFEFSKLINNHRMGKYEMVKSRDYKNILRKKNSRSIFIYTFDSKGMDLRWIRARRRRCRSPPRRGGGFCVRSLRGSQLLIRIGDSFEFSKLINNHRME